MNSTDKKATMLQIAILSIGDELCIGQVVNTNASWMADQCSTLGAEVITHRSIGDDTELMHRSLAELQSIAHIVLMTGGLGPTHDDITKDVLCRYFNDRLVEDAATLASLEKLFAHRKRMLTDRNRAQALVPSLATVLSNSYGSAPGLLFESGGTTFIAMPGVPNEMKAIMREHVLPLIAKRMDEEHLPLRMFRTLSCSGIAESSLADLLGDPEKFLEGQQLAFLPSYSGVRLRFSISASSAAEGELILSRIERHVRERAGEYVVAEGRDGLSTACHKALIASAKTLALAESCTGGMLGAQFTDHPGSSEYFLGGVVCYSNDSKIRDLGVDPGTLKTFGAVSREVVEELASNARGKFGADYAIAISGIAGPGGGSDEKPVGTVWIALSSTTGTEACEYHLGVERAAIRERACAAAQLMLLKALRTNA